MNHSLVQTTPFPMLEIAHFSPRYACVIKGGVKVHSKLANEAIHCTAGYLWVTLEGDTADYVLLPGQSLPVPNQGKVLISGPGCYRISSSIDGLDLAVAS